MYTEFIIGYILMGVLALMLAIVIVLLCIILRKLSRGGGRTSETAFISPKNNAYSGNRGTVVCRNCATQFDPAHAVCPKCGTPR